ncbi:hypothetical protein ELQ35_02585 [Peribacillus cavernae]|uniref:Uncharacterized protein n=1 Tax=Peribacillus cavernae TaxID=1674310 RepID=A0A3S0W3Z0_9BACI|nr:hypothetical protein ELQ35_02585 [Peribacillus cavernae]
MYVFYTSIGTFFVGCFSIADSTQRITRNWRKNICHLLDTRKYNDLIGSFVADLVLQVLFLMVAKLFCCYQRSLSYNGRREKVGII